jgi:hypothetical protein
MKNGSLQHALKSQSRLNVDFLVQPAGDTRRGVVDELPELAGQSLRIGAASTQDLDHLGRVEQRQQQMLDRDELVALLARLLERLVEAVFKFARKHLGLFHRAQQWVLVLLCQARHLRHLGLRDLVRVHAANTLPLSMYLKHDTCRGISVH